MAYRHVKRTFTEVLAKQAMVYANPYTYVIFNFTVSGADRIIRFEGSNARTREYRKAQDIMQTATITYNTAPYGGAGYERDWNPSTYVNWRVAPTTRTRLWTVDFGSVLSSVLIYIYWMKYSATDVYFCVSSDGVTWTDVLVDIEDVSKTPKSILSLTDVRYFALDNVGGITTGDSMAIYSVEAFATPPVKEVIAPAGGIAEHVVATKNKPVGIYILSDSYVSYYVYDIDYIKVTDTWGEIT